MNGLKDIICLWPRWIVTAVFLIAHCLLTFTLPVPGCPTGAYILDMLKYIARCCTP